MSAGQVTLEDAYREACAALGESMVQQRFLGQEIARMQALVPQPVEEPQFFEPPDERPQPRP